MGKVCQTLFVLTGLVGLLLTVKTALSLAYHLSYQWFNWDDWKSYIHARDQLSCDKPFFVPLFWNMGLVLLFVFQHSVMATAGWKSFIRSCGCAPLERSIYVIITCLTLDVLMRYYDASLAFTLWGVEMASLFLLGKVICILHAGLWLVIFLSTLGMDFLEFVGLRQVLDHCFPPLYAPPMEAEKRRARDNMRHSGVACFVVVLWLQPVMSADRFLMSLMFTLYSLFGHHITTSDYNYIKRN